MVFGHRKASNCADSEIVAKPGAFTAETQSKLLAKIKPKGQAPIAAALSDAAKGTLAQGRLDIVLIADGGDTCDADICSTAVAMKEKTPGLRVHVIGIGDKLEELKPLSCLAETTGGTLIVATKADELNQGLATVLDAIVTPPPASPQIAAAPESTSRAGDDRRTTARDGKCAANRSRCRAGSGFAAKNTGGAAATIAVASLSSLVAARQEKRRRNGGA